MFAKKSNMEVDSEATSSATGMYIAVKTSDALTD